MNFMLKEGHSVQECPSSTSSQGVNLSNSHKYGAWLRANSPQRERFIRLSRFTGQPSKDYLSVGGQRRDSGEADRRELFNDGGAVQNKEHMIGGPQSSRKGKEKIGDVIHRDSLLSKTGESPIKGESVDTLPIINERSQENLNDLNIRIDPFTFKSPGIWTCT
ncbi:hypothetical protein ACOSQ4_017076 [Xanthoceras sorbifolium]